MTYIYIQIRPIFLSILIRRTHDPYLCSQWKLRLIPKLNSLCSIIRWWVAVVCLLFSNSSYKVEFKVIHGGGGGLHCVSTLLKFIWRQPEGVWKLSGPKRQTCANHHFWLCLSARWQSAFSKICAIYKPKKKDFLTVTLDFKQTLEVACYF